MTVNRTLFRACFTDLPAWDCPACVKGHLVLDTASFHSVETGPSQRAHDHDVWEPEWIEKRFVGLLVCNFALCREVVAVSGSVSVVEVEEIDDRGDWNRGYIDQFEPKSLIPAPPPIRPVEDTPHEVTTALADAAALIWQSAEAAANQVRQAVEYLMDDQNVKKQIIKSNKRTILTLHARIEEFRKKDPENAEILLAVKWLGNSGSHAGGITRDDVLDAFDMMELVLSNLYGKAKLTIMKKVKAINKARGPAKGRPRARKKP